MNASWKTGRESTGAAAWRGSELGEKLRSASWALRDGISFCVLRGLPVDRYCADDAKTILRDELILNMPLMPRRTPEISGAPQTIDEACTVFRQLV